MAISLTVRNNNQIVVPVRFARAVTGGSVIDAPDVDDRGFAMGARPGTWGSTDARGAMVSLTQGDTVRVKVVRADIDDSAPLFVTSTNTAVLEISGSSGPLAADGVFRIHALEDVVDAPVKVQVRLGSEEGPVLGEMEPHVFQLRQVRVRAHLCSINGVGTVRTAASLVALFNGVNVIWRAAGIQFLYDQTQTLTETIVAATFAVPGQVTTTPADTHEFSLLVNTNPDPNQINVYFVQLASAFTGGTVDHDTPRPGGFGIIFIDIGNAHELAHELGHYLDTDIHAGERVGSIHFRDDVWVERRLLYEFSPLDAGQAAFRHDVSYGNLLPGNLISVKHLPLDPSDGEVARNRRRALNPN